MPSDTISQSETGVITLPDTAQAPIDYLSTILSERLKYGPHERDMVVLAHEVTTEAPDGTPHLFTSSLVQVGRRGVRLFYIRRLILDRLTVRRRFRLRHGDDGRRRKLIPFRSDFAKLSP